MSEQYEYLRNIRKRNETQRVAEEKATRYTRPTPSSRAEHVEREINRQGVVIKNPMESSQLLKSIAREMRYTPPHRGQMALKILEMGRSVPTIDTGAEDRRRVEARRIELSTMAQALDAELESLSVDARLEHAVELLAKREAIRFLLGKPVLQPETLVIPERSPGAKKDDLRAWLSRLGAERRRIMAEIDALPELPPEYRSFPLKHQLADVLQALRDASDNLSNMRG
jgi:hypothetical protein